MGSSEGLYIEMPTQEFLELKEMIDAVDQKVTTMIDSLKRCQIRCIVDNPPGKWRSLGRALLALLRF